MTKTGRTMSACGRHHHRTVAGMCMPALRALARAAVQMSVAEEITTRGTDRSATWPS